MCLMASKLWQGVDSRALGFYSCVPCRVKRCSWEMYVLNFQIENYLLRNHETRKYLQEQAYRLQQGIVTSTTQQVREHSLPSPPPLSADLQRIIPTGMTSNCWKWQQMWEEPDGRYNWRKWEANSNAKYTFLAIDEFRPFKVFLEGIFWLHI